MSGDAMLIAEVRRLDKKLAKLLVELGFKREGGPDPRKGAAWGDWWANTPFNARLRVTPLLDLDWSDRSSFGARRFRGHPWLACCFYRPKGQGYTDLRRWFPGINTWSGKNNLHIHDRVSADQAYSAFRYHLVSMLTSPQEPVNGPQD